MTTAEPAVVVGFDGSDQSLDALRLGSELAAAEGFELQVAAVLPFVAFPADVQALEHALATRFHELFSAAERELGDTGFTPKRLEEASAARGLYELAEREPVGLIVLGSTHRGALGRVMPGSVADRLLSGAPCPIAIAPRGYAQHEAPPNGVIGVGFDGTPESRIALAEARPLARRLGASLRLIAVTPSPATEPAAIGSPILGYPELAREQLESALEVGRAEVEAELEAETVLVDGDPMTALAAQGEAIDLLVLGSRGYGPLRRTLLGGVSSAVTRSAPCPVVVVPRAAESRTTGAE